MVAINVIINYGPKTLHMLILQNTSLQIVYSNVGKTLRKIGHTCKTLTKLTFFVTRLKKKYLNKYYNMWK
jgi:hypothetical protein